MSTSRDKRIMPCFRFLQAFLFIVNINFFITLLGSLGCFRLTHYAICLYNSTGVNSTNCGEEESLLMSGRRSCAESGDMAVETAELHQHTLTNRGTWGHFLPLRLIFWISSPVVQMEKETDQYPCQCCYW